MLKGKKINLRTLRKRDVPEYVELFNDIERRGRFFPLLLHTEASLEQRMDKDGYWSDDSMLLVIVDKQSDHILGFVVAFKPVRFYDAYELGYILFDHESRGKGYVSEAVALFSGYLFLSKPIFRIQLQIEAENAPSLRVAERCGFSFEGTARCAFIRNGKPADIGIYSLTRAEWDARNTEPE